MSDKTAQSQTNPRKKVLRNMDRRTYLGALSGLAGTVAFPAVVQGEQEDTVEIITVRDGNGEPLDRERVPEEWYEHNEEFDELYYSKQEEYGNFEWYGSVGKRRCPETINGKNKFDLVVYAKDLGQAEDVVPDEINDINIILDEWSEGSEPSCPSKPGWCNEDEYDCMKGGAYVECEQSNGTGYSTGGCIVELDDEVHYITDAHSFEDDQCDAIGGHKAYTGTDEKEIGEVEAYDSGTDVAIVDDSGDIDGIGDGIIEDDYPIRGHVTSSGYDSMLAEEKIVNKYGAKTCGSSGQIQERQSRTRCGNEEDYALAEVDVHNGDSGAPLYDVRFNQPIGNYIAIISLITWCADSDTFGGVPAYRLQERFDPTYDLSFTGNSAGC